MFKGGNSEEVPTMFEIIVGKVDEWIKISPTYPKKSFLSLLSILYPFLFLSFFHICRIRFLCWTQHIVLLNVLIKKAFKIKDLAARGPAVWARQAHDVLVLFSCWRIENDYHSQTYILTLENVSLVKGKVFPSGYLHTALNNQS